MGNHKTPGRRGFLLNLAMQGRSCGLVPGPTFDVPARRARRAWERGKPTVEGRRLVIHAEYRL